MKAGGIVVVGSLNMDFVVSVAHLAAPGETILGKNFQMIPGGKGANQACAAGRLACGGMPVRMIGRVGHDVFGDQLKASLAEAGVDVSAVQASRSQPTGVAMIAVDASGQNSIVVASGANMDLRAADVEAMRQVFRGARVALFQLETPLETVAAAMKLAREEGLLTILDPAPAQPLSEDLLAQVDILTPNETEAELLEASLKRRRPTTILFKLGDNGCSLAVSGQDAVHYHAYAVNAVDTTAAGDTFNAALAVALAEEQPMADAVRFANAAAAISVTRMGAQSSAPGREEVEKLLAT